MVKKESYIGRKIIDTNCVLLKNRQTKIAFTKPNSIGYVLSLISMMMIMMMMMMMMMTTMMMMTMMMLTMFFTFFLSGLQFSIIQKQSSLTFSIYI